MTFLSHDGHKFFLKAASHDNAPAHGPSSRWLCVLAVATGTMRKYFYVAGILLPVVLILEMGVHVTELNALVGLTTPEGPMRTLTTFRTNETKPLFVLHIGPSKTGTTTLQSAAARLENLLRQDNMFYLGHDRQRADLYLHGFMKVCLDLDSSQECAEKWSSLEQLIEYHYSQNHNLFLSEEMISQFSNEEVEDKNLWRHLERILSKWQVRIVFTYRRYHEWMPSKFYQANSPNGSNRTREKSENWPDKGGRPIRSFPKSLEHKMNKNNFQLPPNVLKRWKAHFSNNSVQVFNMHQDGDLLENFFCQFIPEAPTICKHICTMNKEGKNKNIMNPSTSKTLHHDHIAVGAYQKGWIVDKDMTREDVTLAVKWHAHKLRLTDLTDFPLECFNQTENLLQQALQYEADTVPDFFASPRGEKELMKQFAEAVKSGTFCSVDLQQTLKQKEWKQFFEQLSKKDIQLARSEERKAKKKTKQGKA